jgi:type IV fimbrial biogenesis protein FimT
MISRHAGFTLIELMITIALIAVLSTIAAPSMRDLVKNARMTALANDFITDLSIARSEAVKRGVRMAICTSSNGTSCTNTGWNQGWIVFTDSVEGTNYGSVNGTDMILKVAPRIDGATETPPTLITSVNAQSGPVGTFVGFRPSGVIMPGGGDTTTDINFYVCDSRTTANVSAGEAAQKGRHVTLTLTGRAHVVRCTCSSGTFCTP